jgi:hypothetical protein
MIGNLVTFAYVNFVSNLLIYRPATAVGLLFVFLLGLMEGYFGESYCLGPPFGEGLGMGLGQPVPRSNLCPRSGFLVK